MNRKINDLHPAAADKCRQIIALSKESGIDIVVTSTLRTEAEQLALFAQGRKTLRAVNELRSEAELSPITEEENKCVTKNLTSVHQFGCAFDVAIVQSVIPASEARRESFLKKDSGQAGMTKKPSWDVKADVNHNHIADYEEIGKLGESIGLRWGGRFTFKDYCHFEYTGGLTLVELKAGKRPDIVSTHPPSSFSSGGVAPIPPGKKELLTKRESNIPLLENGDERGFKKPSADVVIEGSTPDPITGFKGAMPLCRGLGTKSPSIFYSPSLEGGGQGVGGKKKGGLMLSGKKTYIVGIAMALYGVAGAVTGKHDFNTAAQLVLQGLGFVGLRLGVSKAEIR